MAIEVFPDSPSSGISPRISFSHDLPQSDVVPVEQYIRSTSSSSSIDFDFCVFRETFNQEPSSADELFFDGKILPIEIKKRLVLSPPPTRVSSLSPSPPQQLPSSASLPPPSPQKPAKINPSSESEEKQKSTFWRFKRSSSLNCSSGSGSGYGRSLCPLPLLSRSNSTGSTASGKRSSSVSSNQKQSFVKCNSSKQQAQQSGTYSSSSRPPLKKGGHFSHGGGIKFNHVLNVPPATLFGLGSLFSGGKDRSKKKY